MLDKLIEDGDLEEGEDGTFKFSKIPDKGIADKAADAMVTELDKFMKKHIGDRWDSMNDNWKEFYRGTVLGTTREQLFSLINGYGANEYSYDMHRKAHDETLQHILGRHQGTYLSKIKAEHAEDVLKHYIKLDPEKLAKVDMELFKKQDDHVQGLLRQKLGSPGGKVDEAYLKRQAYYSN